MIMLLLVYVLIVVSHRLSPRVVSSQQHRWVVIMRRLGVVLVTIDAASHVSTISA
jgi:hypothetical protein